MASRTGPPEVGCSSSGVLCSVHTKEKFIPSHEHDGGRLPAWQRMNGGRLVLWSAVSLPCGASLDHLVGAREHCWRQIDPERPSGFEIDDQFTLDRFLHRQVRRIGPLEDTVDITGGAPKRIDVIGPIGYETAAGDVVAKGVHGRQSVPRSGRGDHRAVNKAARPEVGLCVAIARVEALMNTSTC